MRIPTASHRIRHHRRHGPPTVIPVAIISVVAAFTTHTCVEVTEQGWASMFPAGTGERRLAAASYDSIWAYGGINDTILFSPNTLLGQADGLYVLDVGRRQVLRFGTAGDFEWAWGGHGEGPGEISRIRAMALDGDGIVVADSDNGRMLWVNADGHTTGEATINESLGSIEGMIVLPSGLHVVEATGTLWPMLTPSGDVAAQAVSPWSDLGTVSSIQRQGKIARADAGDWVFAFTHGNGWVRFTDSIPVGAYPFVVHVPSPTITQHTSRTFSTVETVTRFSQRPVTATHDLKVVNDTVFVLAADGADRVLDRYHLQSGEYIDSAPLPVNASKFDFVGDIIYLVDRTGLSPVIRSYHRKEGQLQ